MSKSRIFVDYFLYTFWGTIYFGIYYKNMLLIIHFLWFY
uniref:Uncharacterized protein n=1 Tax=Manihot esculenta TaxID=3983 RepID=A0A199UC55_MANES